MATDEKGPEPTGWELSRGIDRIEATLREQNNNYLQTQVWLSEKAQLNAKAEAQGAEIAALRADARATADKADITAQRIEDQKGRNKLMIYGIIASPIVAGVILWVINGGLQTP